MYAYMPAKPVVKAITQALELISYCIRHCMAASSQHFQ